jgi:hypothetical protein
MKSGVPASRLLDSAPLHPGYRSSPASLLSLAEKERRPVGEEKRGRDSLPL